ncbi:MAG: hypothetical protein AAF089_15510 [Bacteroidota bacterium]
MEDQRIREQNTALDRRMLAEELGALDSSGDYAEMTLEELTDAYGPDASWFNHYEACRIQVTREDAIIDQRMNWGLKVNTLLSALALAVHHFGDDLPRAIYAMLLVVIALSGIWCSVVLDTGLRGAVRSIRETVRETMRIPARARFTLPHTYWNSRGWGFTEATGLLTGLLWAMICLVAVVLSASGRG